MSRWRDSVTICPSLSMCWRRRTLWNRKAPIRLPEAQLDRFLLQVDVGYPDKEAEQRMLLATTVGEEKPPKEVLNPDILMRAQALVRRLPVGDKVMQAILSLVRSGRPGEGASDTVQNFVAWGPLPARQPGLHAGDPRTRAAGRPLRAFHR